MAAAMESFPGMTEEQTGAIQEWVKARIEAQMDGRFTMASRAIEFVNNIDAKQKEMIDTIRLEAGRVSQIVTDFNIVRLELDTTFADIRASMNTLFEETKVFANKTVETAGGMDAKVDELHAKTKLFADQTIAEIANIKGSLTTESDRLRNEVNVGSADYAKKIAAMVQSGNFSAEGARGVALQSTGKIDKKEVSVWKLSDNVSKPDFRHWLDSVDLQLETIHGFVYPDLVLEKVKRLSADVTAKALEATALRASTLCSRVPTLGSWGWGAGQARERYS